ncbi:MAG: hypothetical protein K0U93_23285 [Gammaproteobacteria bacterium]|nr:hypothetical protein [Gammaproteobacteria bacterium]
MPARSSSKLIQLDVARELVEAHSDLILERLHAVETAAKSFSLTIASSALPAKGLLPIRPIQVFKPLSNVEPTDSLSQTNPPRYQTLSPNASRIAAANVFSEFDYEHEDVRNQSPKCFGVIGAPNYVLEQARQLNHAKDDLKAAFLPISNLRIQVRKSERSKTTGPRFREVSTLLLRETGRSSTNLLAVYRHIPIIDEPVHAIRFMLTHTRSVPRIRVADLKNKAADRPDVLDILNNTPELNLDENLLAPKRRYVRMRAKVLLQKMEAPESKRRLTQIVSAELPLLFPMLKNDSRWPDIKGPGADKRRSGSPPSKLESEPLVTLGAQGYYRLRKEFR